MAVKIGKCLSIVRDGQIAGPRSGAQITLVDWMRAAELKAVASVTEIAAPLR